LENLERAEKLGRLRDILTIISEKGPNVGLEGEFRAIRAELIADEKVNELLPEFIIECRSSRDFWNYIQGAYSSYGARSQYIKGQLLPIERQFRPERQKSPGICPPEVRIEYSPVRPPALTAVKLVSEVRIAQLRAINSKDFDLHKLIRMCEELNVIFADGSLISTMMLTRAILDHIPPIFGQRTFSEVANNYGGGGKSFKDNMDHLDKSARKIADGLLHTQIRAKETLPEPQQVNFSADIDVMLAEIVRILS